MCSQGPQAQGVSDRWTPRTRCSPEEEKEEKKILGQMEREVLSRCCHSVIVHFLMNCFVNVREKVQQASFFNYSKQSHCQVSVKIAGIKLVFYPTISCKLKQMQYRVKIFKPVELGSIWRKMFYCARFAVSTFIDLFFPFNICLPVFFSAV